MLGGAKRTKQSKQHPYLDKEQRIKPQKRGRTRMETLLIINGVLAAITIYFLKEFHNNFKDMVKTVSELKDKFLAHTVKVGEELKNNANRLEKLEEPTKNKRA